MMRDGHFSAKLRGVYYKVFDSGHTLAHTDFYKRAKLSGLSDEPCLIILMNDDYFWI